MQKKMGDFSDKSMSNLSIDLKQDVSFLENTKLRSKWKDNDSV